MTATNDDTTPDAIPDAAPTEPATGPVEAIAEGHADAAPTEPATGPVEAIAEGQADAAPTEPATGPVEAIAEGQADAAAQAAEAAAPESDTSGDEGGGETSAESTDATQTPAPATETPTPATETPAPAGETTSPESPQPANGTPAPAPETAAPETAAPETAAPETAAPAGDAAEPVVRPVPRPGPLAARPTPALVPRRPAVAAPPAAPALPAPSAEAMAFGRVDDDGTVHVRTADGERAVGSYPGADPHDAIAYFARKYDEIVGQVEVFEQRLQAPDVPVSEVDSGLAKLRAAVTEPDVVGDLDALRARVEALAPIASARKAQVDAERNAAREVARGRRTAIIEEAETIAATDPEQMQWRTSGQRMKELFEAWQAEQKTQVRLDRRSQDELWKRFSHARSGFDRKRRHHFAQLDETQGAAKSAKEKLVAQAEALQSSTDWAPTATAYKKLMDRWREAGRAGRKDDDALWARFRAAQDAFFAARAEVTAEQDKEFEVNLAVKLELLTEAEALLPVRDIAATKRSLASVQDRWEAAGKVPRADLERVERRLRAVEQAVRDSEDATWKSKNPEGQARARSAVDQLESAITDLESRRDKARAAGDERRAAEAETAITARGQWLEQARAALRDFGG